MTKLALQEVNVPHISKTFKVENLWFAILKLFGGVKSTEEIEKNLTVGDQLQSFTRLALWNPSKTIPGDSLSGKKEFLDKNFSLRWIVQHVVYLYNKYEIKI